MAHTLLRGAAVTAALAMVVAAPSAASAATPRSHHHYHPQRAVVHGLVVARHGNVLKVLAGTVRVGHRTRHHVLETVVLGGHRGSRSAFRADSARAVRPGYEITARGVAIGSRIVDGTVQSSTPRPAMVVVGMIASIDGPLLTLTSQDCADGHHGGRDGGGNGDGDGNGGGHHGSGGNGASSARPADRPGDSHGEGHGVPLVVDVSTAAISGAEQSVDALTPGEFVVALGERSEGNFVAADLVTYNNPPAFVVGQVSAADQSTNSLTVTAFDGNDSEDGSSPDVAVDTTNALVAVNGAQDGSYPAVGDFVLAVGPDGSAGTQGAGQPGDPIPATVVFAFNGDDHQPAGD